MGMLIGVSVIGDISEGLSDREGGAFFRFVSESRY